ncbi:MAG: hypothetical protein ABF515_10280, partial [Bifidobacterium sp.]
MKKKIIAAIVAIAASFGLAACGSSSASDDHKYVVGVTSDQQKEIWEYVGKQVAKEGITIDVKLFSGYTE